MLRAHESQSAPYVPTLLETYKRLASGSAYDEMIDERGEVRPHWQVLQQTIAQLGINELLRRQQDIARILRENGVTYSIYGDPQGLNRPWQMDAIPFLISSTEWQTLLQGIMQRAELLNMILADIYGERRLLRNGLLPLELIYLHSGFLRQCDQIRLPAWHQLVTYAVDLARGADGKLWVIGDRTQAPSGTGYALENRSTMMRILPDFFQGLQVHRISNYFQASQISFASMAPHHKESPYAAILTPGPLNETYFEHAYLASYLGYTLVQGADLTVRDGYVWLKSLSGLQQVDILLRRVDDSYCDPLELNELSQLGVAGLLECVRRNHVTVVNPLGSGVLENPGLMPFLPSIAKYFLGEELILPSVKSWWCGQEKECRYVLENLDKLIIKNISPHESHRSIFGNRLSAEKKELLIQQIKERPYLYVGQEMLTYSTSPSFIQGQLEPRYSVLRCFAFAQKQGYGVLPGGLTRSAPEPGSFLVSNQTGGTSKDTWVLLEDREETPIFVKTGQTRAALPKSIGVLPSRTAENLYWVGRYSERSLGTARVLRMVLRNLAEKGKLSRNEVDLAVYQTMLRTVTHFTMTYPGFASKDATSLMKNPDNELLSVTLDEERLGSLSNTLASLNRAAYVVRDLWSLDSWRVLDGIERLRQEYRYNKKVSLRNVQNLLDQLITSLVAFIGFNQESMSSEHGWILLDIGKRIERILLQVSMLRSTLVLKHSEQAEYDLMEAVLATEESLATYRYQFRSYLQLSSVLDLLLLDESHPRSMAYHLNRLQENIHKLPRKVVSHRLSEEGKLVLEASTHLKLADPEELAFCGENDGIRQKLDQRLSKISDLLFQTSNVIVRTYFSHTPTQQQSSAILQNPLKEML
ncbi:MAG: circularly permuted type 2 ATP-grasp protein [Cytophagales bacterium]|nr:circularly permuted type 2 ATP-grasp protein [Cytophagales bacterium]MDW8385227.1 circularly permuted type 2 ATP-grasp protein [Flammeovirgaceae bacterium]